MLRLPRVRLGRMSFVAVPALATAAACGSVPAAAQSGVIAHTDAEIAKAKASPYLKMVRNIAPSELVPGTPVVQGDGTLIGTVEGRDGATVILVDDDIRYRVPVGQIYAYSSGAEDHFASRLPKSKLERDTRLGG